MEPRLILPLLIKAAHHHAGMYSQSGKYHLVDGRWKKLHADAPAPKGVPIAHNPQAHQTAPAKHMADDEWNQLKLPAENTNSGHYNAQLSKLKEWSEGGHVGAILGHSYGTNTYGKKLAAIANHLLGKHGSEHKVAPGQKAGEHAAVQAQAEPPKAAEQQPAGDAPPAKPQLKAKNYDAEIVADAIAANDPGAIQNVIGAYEGDSPNEDEKLVLAYAKEALAYLQSKPATGAGIPQSELLAAKERAPKPAPEPKPASLAMPEFVEGKTVSGVVEYYQKVAQQVLDLAESGDVAALEQMKASGLKPNSKGKVSNTWANKTPNSKILLALHKQALEHAKGSAQQPAQPGGTPGEGAGGSQPKQAAAPAPQAGTGDAAADALDKLAADIAAAGSGGKANMIAMDYVTGNQLQTWAMSDAIDALEAAGYSKEAQTFKELKALNDADDAKAKASQQAAAAPAPAQATAPAPSSNLAQIPWDKLQLPDTNSNAKSHNGQVAKIKAMAEAGDTAGLQAYIDAKGDAKQTYAKKQKLLAQTALAALKEAPAQAAAPAQPAENGIDSITTEQEAGIMAWLNSPDGDTLPEHIDFQTLYHSLTPTLKKQLVKKQIKEAKRATTAKPDAATEAATQLQELTDLAGKAGYGVFQHPSKGFLLAGSKTGSLKTFANIKQAEAAAVKMTELGVNASVIGTSVPYLVALHGKLPEMVHQAPGLTPEQESEVVNYLHSGIGAAATKQLYDSLTPEQKSKLEAKAGVAAPSGPKEGDTKPGADGGMLVFKNGRWHKQAEELHPNAKAMLDTLAQKGSWSDLEVFAEQDSQVPAAVKAYAKELLAKKAASEPAAATQHPVDAIAVPDAIGLAPNKSWAKNALNSIALLKEKLKAGDTDVLKGATKHMSSSGKYIVKLPYPANPSVKWTFKGSGAAAKALYEHVEELKAAMGKPAKKPAKPKAATPAAPVSAPGAIEAMDSWVQTGGQGGSNPGGKFKDPSGQEWYCKFPGDDDTAKSEVLAAKLYSLAGLASQDAKLITKGGKIGIASKWVDVKKAGSPAALAAVQDAQSGFAVDAWLANWDVVGLGYDNLQIGADGKAVRVDAGGSLEYRAQGAKKPFGPEVTELKTLLDKKSNPQAASVFGGMTEADITASVAKVLKISDVAIRAVVNQFGPGDAAAKQKLADTLIARKADLAKKYPAAAKAKKAIIFKPEEISAPPSFTNWGNTGKSGPSSKEFVNQANEKAVQAIFAAAKTGDMAAVQNLSADTLNKETGEVTGSAKVLEHPSQHVKGYAQQVINEISYQLNPPKKFRFEGGHPLNALHSAYPSHPGTAAASGAVQKLGKYIVLGEPGTIQVEDLQLPPAIKHASAGGPLSSSTYAKKAQDAVAQMPKTQQQAIQSYTGSSYHEMNGSLWSGNPTGAAKAAGEALKTLGHDIEPGTLLSRKISLHGGDLDQLLKSAGKVLQEPDIMSTSIRPSSWSGNVQLKLRVGPGVKGLWVGNGSMPGGGAMSKHSGEDEMILPPNTRLLVVKVSKGADSDGFGAGGMHVVECVVLPT